MSSEKRPVNDNEDAPGKPEGKIDTPADENEPASPNPVSASDRAQADIKSHIPHFGKVVSKKPNFASRQSVSYDR